MKRSDFGITTNGEKIQCFTLSREGGLTARIIDWGGIITELHVPDNQGKYADVVLGFNDAESYMKENIYAGAIVGRIAGRLTNGRFYIKGKRYQLTQNEGSTHLHGGFTGFDKKLWGSEIVNKEDDEALQLKYHSQDGAEGYPGNVYMTVTYSLTVENGLRIDFKGTADQPTPLCPTNHSYFNLAGEGSGTICDHLVQIDSDRIIEVDKSFLPTGKINDVVYEKNDCRKATPIKNILGPSNLSHGGMYVLNTNGKDMVKAATVWEPHYGRIMEVHTTTPYLQLYSGMGLDTNSTGKSFSEYGKFSGLCLECQGFSDSPNHMGFRSIFLYPEEIFYQSTEYRFKG